MARSTVEDAPAWTRPMLEFFDERMADSAARDPFRHKPHIVEQYVPYFQAWCDYFDTDVQGWEHLPDEGPFMVVGNHSGGAETNDAAFFLCRWVTERGPGEPIYVLAYDLLFGMPGVGRLLPSLGVVPANPDNARAALDRGDPVMVFPGGDYEVFRPWSHRDQIDFGGHKGFVKIALEAGVPVVPMTIHGAHESTFILTRGSRLARLIGLDRLRVHDFPIIFNIPFGITPVFVPSVQLPAKVTVGLDAPLDWSDLGPEAAEDPEVVDRCYDEITSIMQATMDRLERETPHPVVARVTDLVAGATRAAWSVPRRLLP